MPYTWASKMFSCKLELFFVCEKLLLNSWTCVDGEMIGFRPMCSTSYWWKTLWSVLQVLTSLGNSGPH